MHATPQFYIYVLYSYFVSEISKGSVEFIDNDNLCYAATTIMWEDILNPKEEQSVNVNSSRSDCKLLS